MHANAALSLTQNRQSPAKQRMARQRAGNWLNRDFSKPEIGKLEISFGELPDERSKWEARLRSWRQSKFWLPLWGPQPDQPGCFAPASLTAS